MAVRYGVLKIVLLLKVYIYVLLRSILGVKRRTPLYMICGELGRCPPVKYVKSRMINYWCRMLNSDNKISNTLEYIMPFYLIMFMEHMYINGLIL